jgi:hypothetical protein
MKRSAVQVPRGLNPRDGKESDAMTPKPHWSGECMVLSWSETSTRGRTVTFLLPEDDEHHPFRDLAVKQGKRAGQRLYAVFVLLSDTGDGGPDQSHQHEPGENLVQEAAILCRKQSFRGWVARAHGAWIETEREARDWLCQQLSIDSRSQLSTNREAAMMFRVIVSRYEKAMSVFQPSEEQQSEPRKCPPR